MSELLVAAVTKWGRAGLFAIAQPDPALFGHHKFFGTKAGPRMLAIAHGLVSAEAAGAPEIHPGLQFQLSGLGGVDLGLHKSLKTLPRDQEAWGSPLPTCRSTSSIRPGPRKTRPL